MTTPSTAPASGPRPSRTERRINELEARVAELEARLDLIVPARASDESPARALGRAFSAAIGRALAEEARKQKQQQAGA